MRNYQILIIFLCCYLFSVPSNAQVEKQYDEFFISEGLLSFDQLDGIFGQVTPASWIMSFPSQITGAAFLTYRHHFSQSVNIGVSLGLDNQTGDLSYGKDGINGGGFDGVSGNYKREVYTGAAELQFTYRSGLNLKTYGCIGAGYTSTRVTFNFNDNIFDQTRFYGTPNSLFLNKNTTVDFSHFNFQVTPIGFRTGNALAVFIEFGFGYKGIISGGLCYSIGKKYYSQSEQNKMSLEGMVLIPPDFPVDSNIKKIGEIESKYSKHKDDHIFSRRLERFSIIAKEKKSNAVSIKEILPVDGRNPYDFRGVGYHTDSLEALRANIVAKTKKTFSGDSCAYLVIYRTNFYKAHFSVALDINDTNKIFLDAGTAYIIKIYGEKKIKISTDHTGIELNTSFGEWYYINVENKVRPGFELVDIIQGVIESSLVDKTVFYDFKSDSFFEYNRSMPVGANISRTSDTEKIVFIPGDYPVDSKWEFIEGLNSGKPRDMKDPHLKYQLQYLSEKAIKDSANVIKILALKKMNCIGCYWLKAKAWYADNVDSIRTELDKGRLNEKGKDFATIVIYRADGHVPPFKKCMLRINDTGKYAIETQTKYILKVPYDGKIKCAVSEKKVINIDVKKGNVYYLKAKVLKRGCDIEAVEEIDGKIESSILPDVQFIE